MASFSRFQAFVEHLAEKVHDFSNDTIAFQLLNSAPDVAADAVEADLPADISTGGGYTSGGVALTKLTYFLSSSQTSGTYRLRYDNTYTLTATGASIGPFRYIVLFNQTTASDNLIGYYDYGSSITLVDGEGINFGFNTTDGIFSIT